MAVAGFIAVVVILVEFAGVCCWIDTCYNSFVECCYCYYLIVLVYSFVRCCLRVCI